MTGSAATPATPRPVPPRPARSPRALAGACAGLAAAAALLWGGSAAHWYQVTVPDRAAVEFTGAQVSPSLTGVALLALAGVAGLVAVGGVARRLVGALLGGVGVIVGVIATRALLVAPFATDAPAASLPQPPSGLAVDVLRHQPTDTTPAPLLAVAGGVVLLVVGVFVVFREPRLPRLGARYARPGKRPPEVDPDRAAWQALDAGVDPTADVSAARGDDPDGRPRNGLG